MMSVSYSFLTHTHTHRAQSTEQKQTGIVLPYTVNNVHLTRFVPVKPQAGSKITLETHKWLAEVSAVHTTRLSLTH